MEIIFYMNFRYYRFKEISKYKPYRKITDKLITPHISLYLALLEKEVNNKKLKNCEIEKIAKILMNYKVKIIDLNEAGGTCDYKKKTINIGNSYHDHLHIKRIFCHEFAHAIQADLGMFNTHTKSLSYWIYIEQQAETMSSLLFDIFFPALKREKRRLRFNSYFKFEHFNFLYRWYRNSGFKVRNDVYYKI